MRIPNKFNGYSADNRRLYYDPLTLAALTTAAGTTTAAAGTGAALTAAAAPALTTAATTAAVPLATTTAANLGTTAALEAGKQGIIQAGAQQAGIEAAKSAGIEATKQAAAQGAQQAGTETLKQGIMQGADDAAALGTDQVAANTAQQVTEQSIQNGLNNVNNLSANLNPSGVRTASDAGTLQGGSGNILPQKVNTDLDAAVKAFQEVSTTSPTSVAPPTVTTPGTTSVNPIGPNAPDIATNSLQLPETAYQQSGGSGLNPFIKNSTQSLKANPGMEVGQANLQAPTTSPTAGLKPPPSALERGFSAAKQFAGDTAKFAKDHPYITTAGIMAAQSMSQPSYNQPAKKKYSGSGGNRGEGSDFKYRGGETGEYTPIFEPTKYYAVGGPVEQMSAQNAVGSNTMYPQSQLQTPMYSNPMVQRPMPTNVINPSGDVGVDRYSGEMRMASGGRVSAFEKMIREEKERQEAQAEVAQAQIEKGKSLNPASKPYSRTQSTNTPYAAAIKEFQALNKKYGIPTAAPAKTNVDLMGDQDQIEYAANGGIMHGLGGYSDGGRLLRGPGDGVSDSIPAVIGKRQPARLADGEFVIPARIVSELGNGSTEAGARKLYAMMERVQKRRGKTVGKGKVAVNSKADKHLPA